jgi:quercetin dioxygenase-like cupin family protein
MTGTPASACKSNPPESMLSRRFHLTSETEPSTTSRDTSPAPVVRHVLGSSHPAAAPGETLELVQYIIPAGAVLPVHKHPGDQMATVESGTLTYHVVEHGSVTVNRADETTEVVGPGEMATFHVGDSWVEPIGMIHYAENLTTEPVVLMSSSLLADDEPATEIVTETRSR